MAFIGTPLDTRNTFQSLVGKRFDGDGSTTDFTLDVAPGNVLDIEVFVGNVRQDPNSAYTLSGTTLTFTGAPPSGTNNIYVVHQAKSVGTIDVPALGVSTASIQADAITEAKIADDAVESEHLNNNIISGQTALGETPADTDEFLVSDGGTIKRVDYSHIKGGGITQSDMWIMTGNITEDVGYITANWSRYTGSGGNIGSALTESSGVFTFPSTGYYKIDYIIGFRNQSSDYAFTDVYLEFHYTTNNSSYTAATSTIINVPAISSSNVYANGTGSIILDVTNTSNVKFKLYVNAYAGASQQNGIIIGSSSKMATGFTCVRLGDT